MKKYIKYLFLLGVFTSCEDVLDKKMRDALDNNVVWNDASRANLYLNDLYNLTLPGFSGGGNSGLSDESQGAGVENMMYGMLSPTGAVGNYGVETYGIIRRINIMLEELSKSPIADNDKNRLRGQALMNRAWVYWEMVKLYGGVPMVMENQSLNAVGSMEGLYMERQPAARNIELIIRDLDEAIEKLPVSWPQTEYGRYTKAAAAALKGRILLYYASPQFNPNNDAARWTIAHEANKQAKQLAMEAGHALHTNFGRIFLDEANKEAIIVTVFDATRRTHGYEQSVRPSSVKTPAAASSNLPTWEFVKAFPMIDGKPIEGNPEYNETLFWKNRDPRLNATVAYNSVLYDLPGDRIYSASGKPRRQWTYVGNNQEGNLTTRSGFYLRKMVNPTVPATETNRTPTDWIELRYAEVLLNLAEAANEAGAIEEAYTELKAIRQRAGIQPGADGNYGLQQGMSKEAMRDAVMLERQIELAFENKRHWDLRRRNLFVQKLNGTRRTGIRVTLNFDEIIPLANVNPNASQAQKEAAARVFFETNIRDNTDWTQDSNYLKYFRTEYNVDLEQEGRTINYLQPKYNFYFIPQVNLDRDPKIQQTINWTTDGSGFDPLK